MEVREVALLGEPDRWLLIFHREASSFWTGIVAPGKYKHVSAMGYVAALQTWVYYDVQFGGVRIALARQGEGFRQLHAAVIGNTPCDTMWMPRGKERRTWTPRLFLCTTAIAHLVGLRSGTLLPSTLWKHCLANGGEIFDGGTQEAGPTTDQPAVRSSPAAGG